MATEETTSNYTGRQHGAVGWTQQEFTDLFTVMEHILPVGSDQWGQVAQIHGNKYPTRCLNSIRRKYNILCRKQIPTGDPMCPPEVRWAKKIMHLIAEKCELAHCEEKFDLVNGFPEGYVAPPLFVPGADRPRPEPPAPAPPAEAFDPVQMALGQAPEMESTLASDTVAPASKTPSKRAYKSTNKVVESLRNDLKEALAKQAETVAQQAAQQSEMMSSLMKLVAGQANSKSSRRRKKADSDSESESDSDSDDSIVLKPAKKKRLGGKPTRMRTRRS